MAISLISPVHPLSWGSGSAPVKDDDITGLCCGQCFHVKLDNASTCFVIPIVNGTRANRFVHCAYRTTLLCCYVYSTLVCLASAVAKVVQTKLVT